MYRSTFPQSKQTAYVPDTNVDFVVDVESGMEMYDFCLAGSLLTYLDATASPATYPVGATRLYIDPKTGAHALIRDVSTQLEKVGIVENMQNYPRYVKMRNTALLNDESCGTESANCIELVTATERNAKGLIEGVDAASRPVPFNLRLEICLNRTDKPLRADETGAVKVRLRLPPAREVYYGEDYVAGTSYRLSNLRLDYRVRPVSTTGAINMLVMQSYRTNLNTNIASVSTFVAGVADSVAMSFISEADEVADTQNYLALQAPPAVPPEGYQDADGNPVTDVVYDYGIERLNLAVSDNETALAGFVFDSREEIMYNGLRAFNAPPSRYGALLKTLRNPAINRRDGYLAGLFFGNYVDFSKNKFSCTIETSCDNTNIYAAYLYFRMLVTL